MAHSYADGEYWDDSQFWIPQAAATAEVRVLYQTVTRHYIEALRDGNQTNHWGDTLHDLWEQSGRAAPITMASASIALGSFVRGDFNGNGVLDEDDVASFRVCLNNTANAEQCRAGDFNGDGRVDCADAQALIAAWPGPAPAPEFTACRGAVAVSIPALHPTLLMLLGLLLAGMALRQLKATLKS